MAASAYLRHDRHRLGFGAPADGEAAGNGPTFDSHGKRWRFAGSHFNIWQFLNGRLARRDQVWLVRQVWLAGDVFYKDIPALLDFPLRPTGVSWYRER
jgi:hypothetical protein